jgi:DNA-binding NtrC family response regulator
VSAAGTAGRVVIVDDEEAIRFVIRDYLQGHGFEIQDIATVESLREVVRSWQPDALVLDYRLHEKVSLDVIPDLKRLDADLAIIVLTGHGTIQLAVEAIKLGADHFLTKPVELAALRSILERACDNRRTRKREAARERGNKPQINPFIGESEAIRELHRRAERVAAADRPVLIQGETGSGKGVLAKWIHASGPRAKQPFVDLNCAGLSRELLEAELFGYERGAFTGATTSKPGLFEVAHRGSVFLDEIGDMDLSLQAKLLKAVEEKRFRRVGEIKDRQVDIRLIAATHRDLAALAAEGSFRSDLYFRISTLLLDVPPLRQRPQDIVVIARHFVEALARELGHRPAEISPRALAALQQYSWPGNIRELRNVVERMLLVSDATVFDAEHLHFDAAPRPITPDDATLAAHERTHILQILEAEDGHVDRAAARLGIPRSSLYQKLRKYGVNRSR